MQPVKLSVPCTELKAIVVLTKAGFVETILRSLSQNNYSQY